MRQWSGKIFVFRDALGFHRISLSFPTDSGISTVHTFQVNGPYIPIGLQKSITVDDADLWIWQLQEQGFNITPSAAD